MSNALTLSMLSLLFLSGCEFRKEIVCGSERAEVSEWRHQEIMTNDYYGTNPNHARVVELVHEAERRYIDCMTGSGEVEE